MSEHQQTTLFFVRHGETDNGYALERSVDSERQLTADGREHARKDGEYLAQFPITAIYSSPLDRCVDTAKEIAKEIGYEKEIIKREDLVEVYSKEPAIRKEVGERGETIFGTILKEHRGEQVVAVSHQYIIGYTVADFFGIEYRDVPCDCADIYKLVFADDTLVEVTHLQPAKTAE